MCKTTTAQYTGAERGFSWRNLLEGELVEPSRVTQLRALGLSAFGVILFSANRNRPKEPT